MKKASVLMIVGAALLLALFYYPLWSISLKAPQYPVPLGMNIHIDGLQDVREFDIQNIDGLNHYIGMKLIPKPDEMWEFSVFPKVIAGMSILGIFVGILGFLGKVKPKLFLAWLVLMSVLGILGMYDFNSWLLDYGSDLDPNAIMSYVDAQGNPMVYKPPLWGHTKLLNFDAYSFPGTGAYIVFVGLGLVLLSYFVGKASLNKK